MPPASILGQGKVPTRLCVRCARRNLQGMMSRSLCMWLVAIILFIQPWLCGAAETGASDRVTTIYPMTTGTSHSPDIPISRVVVLSAQTGASATAALAAAKAVFQRGGITIIEHTGSALPREAQGPHRGEPSESAAPFLAVGQSLGADHVILVEVTDTLILEKHRSGGNTYLHDERVSVRGIGVKSGRVVLEGTGRWSQAIDRAGDHIKELTAYAIARAICAPEKWVEASAANDGRGRCRS